MCTLTLSVLRARFFGALLGTLLAGSLSGCGGSGNSSSTPAPAPVPLTGKTSFVSADFSSTLSSPYVAFNTATMTTATNAADVAPRTVIEGDIYRVLDAGKTLLNLNSTRGLQIIDIQNPDAPKMSGRAPIYGNPVEMYVVGDKVYALLNNWTQYQTVLKEGKEALDRFHGAALVTIDIRTRGAPKVISTIRLSGTVNGSRLATGAGKSALYVVTDEYINNTVVTSATSFVVDPQGNLQNKASLTVSGSAGAMQVSNDRLLIAHNEYQEAVQVSSVNVIDIASPDGEMVQGSSVRASGWVRQKNNMHVQGNILRIVSSNSWSSTSNTNHFETFNIADIKKPVPLDHARFGSGEQLYGTTFLADRAFFVTYLRTDPFHAFSISADGRVREEAEFIVSGWNDFFRPVASNTRLIGIGHNDQNNRRALSVSLYDASNLKNTQPLLARAELDLSHSWSEANWDDRAFTVIENATQVLAANGKDTETGLVLLPFSGWDSTAQEYQSGVQLFSFSEASLTRRGVMKQASPVRRSTLVSGDAAPGLALNLSDSELTLSSVSNPNTPVAKGRLDLVANFTQFLPFANVGVRYRASDFSWWGQQSAVRRDKLELVSLNDVDNSPAIATLEVPAGSRIFNLEGQLVVFSYVAVAGGFQSTIASYDISNASTPRLVGQVKTDAIKPSGMMNWYTDQMICVGIVCGGRTDFEVLVVGSSLVFSHQSFQYYPAASEALVGRYASNLELTIVDLSNRSRPSVLPQVVMPKDEEAVNLMPVGKSLWINYKKSQTNTNSSSGATAKFYVKELNLATPNTISFGKEINIPGQLMSVAGDKFYTAEYTWNAKALESTLNMLIVQNDLAYLQASYKLPQFPSSLVVEGATLALTAYDNVNYQRNVHIFEVGTKEFTPQSSIQFGDMGDVKMLRQGKLLLQNFDGFLLLDISQPKTPGARSFFATYSMFEGAGLSVNNNDIYVAAHQYGIYQFDFNTVNLVRQ